MDRLQPDMSMMPDESATQIPGPLPPRRRIIQNEAEVDNLPYFHGLFLCQEEIADLMLPFLHTDGCYLLRNSKGQGPGNYTLSITHQGGIKHIRIYKTSNTFYLEDRVHFTTIQQLIESYAKTDIPNIEKVEGVKLLYPILKQKACWLETPLPVPKNQEFSSLPLNNNVQKSEVKCNSLPLIVSESAVAYREKSISESEKLDTDVKLPISPQKKKKFFTRRNSKENVLDKTVASPPRMKKIAGPKDKPKNSDKSNLSSANTSPVQEGHPDFNSKRPPLPIPRQNEPAVKQQTGPYSIPRDIETDRTFDLIGQLTVEERQKLQMCPCGLPLKESQLPAGWRVHRIKDGVDKGKIFYQIGNETTWVLPIEIYEALNPAQKMFIERVKKGKFGISHLSTSGIPGKAFSPKHGKKPKGNTLPLVQPGPPSADELKKHKLFLKDNDVSSENGAESGSSSSQSEISSSGVVSEEPSTLLNNSSASNTNRIEAVGQSVSQRIAAINSEANNFQRGQAITGIPSRFPRNPTGQLHTNNYVL